MKYCVRHKFWFRSTGLSQIEIAFLAESATRAYTLVQLVWAIYFGCGLRPHAARDCIQWAAVRLFSIHALSFSSLRIIFSLRRGDEESRKLFMIVLSMQLQTVSCEWTKTRSIIQGNGFDHGLSSRLADAWHYDFWAHYVSLLVSAFGRKPVCCANFSHKNLEPCKLFLRDRS